MYFKRNLSSQLSVWKRNSKKPLLLQGIRKVGKTTLAKEWGATKFDDVAYFDLNDNHDWANVFYSGSKPENVIEKLATIRCCNFDYNNSLIILDNLDTCPNALEYFSKFNRLSKRYPIIGISSYFKILSQSYKTEYFDNISIKTLYPLSFKEYLQHTSQFGKASYTHYVNRDHIKSIRKKYYSILKDQFENYLFTGGLPEAAAVYHETKSKNETLRVKQNILNSIQSDFLNFNSGVLPKRIYEVWISTLHNIENNCFKFSSIDSNSRYREYRQSIQWLKMAGLIYDIKTENNTRYIPVDIGLMRAENANGVIKTKDKIVSMYALGSLVRKYSSLKIIDGIIHAENKSNRILIACMSNKGIRKFISNPMNKLLVQLKMSDSQLTPNVLKLPVFFVDEISKFNRTAIKQLETNYFPEKRAGDFY